MSDRIRFKDTGEEVVVGSEITYSGTKFIVDSIDTDRNTIAVSSPNTAAKYGNNPFALFGIEYIPDEEISTVKFVLKYRSEKKAALGISISRGDVVELLEPIKTAFKTHESGKLFLVSGRSTDKITYNLMDETGDRVFNVWPDSFTLDVDEELAKSLRALQSVF